MLLAVIRFLVLAAIKVAGILFYSWDARWIGERPLLGIKAWRSVRLVVILNHTSLFEPTMSRLLPFAFLWRLARHATFPVADKTMARPVVGFILRLLAPKVISITRARDASWSQFLEKIDQDAIILIAPEGRMKRPNGLDKDGNPMTVRGGIAEILHLIESGTMLIAYSGGLHHVQAPGQGLPHLFRRIAVVMEAIDIVGYKNSLKGVDEDSHPMASFKLRVIRDLETRRDAVLEQMSR